MRHIRPHRWADAQAGRVPEAERHSMEAHARACPACSAARDRVMKARAALPALRDQDAPSLPWEHIGARIYWALSSERRAQGRRAMVRRRWPAALALATTATLVATGLLWTMWPLDPDPGTPRRPEGAAASVSPGAAVASMPGVGTPASRPFQGSQPTPMAPPAQPPARLSGVITLVQGTVRIDGAPASMHTRLEHGSRIETGAGRIAVQFGPHSGLLVTERSVLVLEGFDQGDIVLSVDGEVLVDLAPRAPQQSFVVRAGKHEVAVRGTAFRVAHRDSNVDVACGKGAVVVSDGTRELDVRAGQWVRLPANADFASPAAVRRGSLELTDAIARQHPVPLLPGWPREAASEPMADSAILDVAAPAGQPVEIDGVPVGAGAFMLRVMPGRHHIEAKGEPGVWIELDAGGVHQARVSPPAASEEPGRSAGPGLIQRRKQLQHAVGDNAMLQGCMRILRKQGLGRDAYVVLDIGILDDGTIGHLNIVDTNLPRSAARCVRETIGLIDFPSGTQASLRERIAL